MKMKLLALSIVIPVMIPLLLSCTHFSDVFMMKRDEVLNHYASAIRWGHFEEAADSQDPARRTPLDLAWLKNIHVSGYDQLHLSEEDDGNTVQQTVEIRYFNELDGTERIITDRQTWHYDDDAGKWRLQTDLPAFR